MSDMVISRGRGKLTTYFALGEHESGRSEPCVSLPPIRTCGVYPVLFALVRIVPLVVTLLGPKMGKRRSKFFADGC